MERIILVLTFVGAAMRVGAANWNYNYSDPRGPPKWPSIDATCNGSSQSPINIVTSGVQYDSNLGQLNFINYDNIPAEAKVQITNNGYSFVVEFLSQMTYFVSGGGLPRNYTTLQFHLHWGSTNDKGSEHKIDGKVFPGVIHLLAWDTQYATITEALNHSGGVAAFGILLQVGDENPVFNHFLKYTNNVTTVGNITNVPQTFNLGSIFPANKDFYRYSGSVTTPHCYESVTWTVFKTQVNISTSQLNKLRSLKETDGVTSIQDNYRPLQQLNSRVIKSNFVQPTAASPTTDDDDSSACVTMPTMLTVVMVTLISKFF